MEELEQLGTHVRQWRILLGLSQELAAERADISLPTWRRIERGEPGVKMASFMSAASVLGLAPRLVGATDPLETDLGKLRAPLLGRQRARRRDV